MVEVTEWFHVPVKPVRVGVYQTYDPILKAEFYNYFDGENWHWGNAAIDCVRTDSDVIDEGHVGYWRGLTGNSI